jgi:VIT1/CCC1 family predicted Fe2+/Mn2+ transporter
MDDVAAAEPAPSRGLLGWTEREEIREGVLMALYIGLSLLAVLLISPSPDAEDTAREVAGTVFLTALGLVLAHQVAFRLATRLVSRGELDDEARVALKAQRRAGFLVAVVAALPVLLLGGDTGLMISELLMLGMVAVVGYVVGRLSGRSPARSLLYVVGLTLVVGVVLMVKTAVGH